MKSSYLTAGIRFPRLFRLLRRNRISYRPKYLLRLLFLLQSSLWASIFSFFEDLQYRVRLRSRPVPDDIIFIIGHWRTGSTFLHKLMSMDPLCTCPTLFQVALPDSFLSSYNYFRPVMNASISRHRPMDNVRLGMNEPQEDEYAFYRITGYSPLEKMIFPDCRKYFLNGEESFIPLDGGREEWESQVKHFFTKIRFHSEKTIVSKNPFNSMRIRELSRMFPQARFIHIYRDPFHVIPSTIHMWDIVQRQNCLNRNYCKPALDEVVEVFDRIMKRIRKDLGNLPREKVVEIRYEDLDRDPAATIHKIYSHFGLPYTPAFEARLQHCIAELKGYKKNSFTVSDGEKAYIRDALQQHMEHYGYC